MNSQLRHLRIRSHSAGNSPNLVGQLLSSTMIPLAVKDDQLVEVLWAIQAFWPTITTGNEKRLW
jgi:hypothetical protein